MKLGAPVYVPTEQFLATIINWPRGYGRKGARIAEENGSETTQLFTGSFW